MIGMSSKEWEKRKRVSVPRCSLTKICYIEEPRNGKVVRGRNETLKGDCLVVVFFKGRENGFFFHMLKKMIQQKRKT